MDDRDLSLWLDFFKQNKADLSLFKIYLKEKDLFFLNNQLDLDYDDENYGIAYPGGFIEKDFQEILKDENNEDRYYNTRLAMVLDSDISIEKIKNRIGKEKFTQVIEYVLILGKYEDYNIDFVSILKKAIKKNYIPKENFGDIAFLRGVELGNRE